MERIADTTGGKIAAAIKAQGSGTADDIDVPDQQPAPSFGDNSLAGADPPMPIPSPK
jgi:type IV secretion system protein TrbL